MITAENISPPLLVKTDSATRRRGRGVVMAVRLACQDARHEWRMTLCLVAALAAVLTPLLVLFGLKYGIVSAMTQRLLENPLTREIRLVGSYPLGPDWFEMVAARPDVAFVLPRTRSLAATLDALAIDGRSLPPLAMQPTAPGDPLLAGLPLLAGPFDVIVSQPLSQSLKLDAERSFQAIVSRSLNGRTQNARVRLRVVGVVPEALTGRHAVFVDPDLLIATERYRSGFAVPLLGIDEGEAETTPPLFASARLFATSLEDVAELAGWLRSQGFEVQTEAQEIELVRSIDRTLSTLYLTLASIAVTGFVISLAASLWANVERKRRDLALLRLVGFSSAAVSIFPATQAAIVALVGSAASLGIYVAISALLNTVFAENLPAGGFVCRLTMSHAATAVLLTLFLAIASSSIGGLRANRIDPADSLRDV